MEMKNGTTMSRYSNIFEYESKLFRYDYKTATVMWISPITEEEKKDNENWIAKTGHPLYNLDNAGYMIADSIGLSREHWDDMEARCEYLDGYIQDLEEEAIRFAEEFSDLP